MTTKVHVVERDCLQCRFDASESHTHSRHTIIQLNVGLPNQKMGETLAHDEQERDTLLTNDKAEQVDDSGENSTAGTSVVREDLTPSLVNRESLKLIAKYMQLHFVTEIAITKGGIFKTLVGNDSFSLCLATEFRVKGPHRELDYHASAFPDTCVPRLSHHHFRYCPQTSAQPPPSVQAGRAQSEAEVGCGDDSSRTYFRCFRLENIYKNGSR